MVIPANVQTTLVNLTTNAVANTQTNTTLVAAPGPGFRWRLWKMVAICLQNAAAQTVRLYVYETTSGTFRGFCTFTVGVTGLIDLAPHGGVAFTSNNAIGAQHYDTLATQTLPVIVYYTLEAA